MSALTLYYDGNCRICRAQMARLRQQDKTGGLDFCDIAAADFSPSALGVSMAYRALARNRYRLSACVDGACTIARLP